MKRCRQSTWLSAALYCLGIVGARAQTPASAEAAGGNLLKDANAEQTTVYENLWDGVDDGNHLRVRTDSLPVLPEGGGTSLQLTPLPCSPAFVDLNADGLRDLLVCSPAGYIWVYLNSGSRGEPRFTTGSFLRTFAGFGSKIHPMDWDGDGDIDIVIGTFYGDVVVMENVGNNQAYDFVKDDGIPRYVDPRFSSPQNHRLDPLRLGKDMMLIGNYMAPWVHDWNGDGKPDLLMGEGTYSANSVRLLVNAGTRKNPKFVEDKVFFLAYGEGHEHLTPASADFDGDGVDDLLMGTRKGDFRLHKGTRDSTDTQSAVAALGRDTPPPAILELEREFRIPSVGGMSVAYPCDWNEDERVDLLLGGTDGRIRIAVNRGTREAPEYGEPSVLKGTDVAKDSLRTPPWFVPDGFSVWSPHWYELGRFRAQNMCNAATLFTSEVSMTTGANKRVEAVEGKRFLHFRYHKDYLGWVGGSTEGARVLVYGTSFPLVIGKRYQLSFSRLGGKGGMAWVITGVETVSPSTEEKPSEHAHRAETKTFGASPNAWRKQEWTFRFTGENKGQSVTCHLFIALPKGDCNLALDDFILKEIAK